MDKLRSSLKAEKRAVISKVMNLSKEDAVSFLAIYDEYEIENSNIIDQKMLLIKDYLANQKSMNDDITARLMNDFIEIRKKLIKLEEEFLQKFKEFLPVQKVAKFYQINRQISMTFDLQLNEQLPFIGD